MGNITTEFHLLPSCDGCVVFSGISTARNLEKFLDLVKLDSTNTREQFTTNAVYLMGREERVRERKELILCEILQRNLLFYFVSR